MSSNPRSELRGLEDDWNPPEWGKPGKRSNDASRTDRESADPWFQKRTSYPARPAQVPRDMLLLAIAPGVTALLATLMWLLSPLPGAGQSAAAMFVVATVQAVTYLATHESRSVQVSVPFLIDLTGTVGLLPLLAIQLSLMREPYVSFSEGSAWPAILATTLAVVFLAVVGVATAFRFWLQPDQASLVFLPVALLVPAAIGNRGPITLENALIILAISMVIGTLATVAAAPLTVGMRLVVPPAALGIEMIVLWITDRGPVFHPTSGTIVSLLYVTMVAATIALVVAVPIISVRIRYARMRMADPVAAGPPSGSPAMPKVRGR